MTAFTLTEDHLALLRHMYVNWQDCETGAPEIDPKRPYGNSSVAYDVADILGWPHDAEGDITDEQQERALAIHRETDTALQIVLITGEMKPGRFVLREQYKRRSWERVSSDQPQCARCGKEYADHFLAVTGEPYCHRMAPRGRYAPVATTPIVFVDARRAPTPEAPHG